MTELLPGLEGEKRKPELSQWFTPKETAKRIVEFSGVVAGLRVLEPSAGRGALAKPLRDYGHMVTCVDIDAQNAEYLARCGFRVVLADFLELSPETCDLVVMNPPFEGGQTERHILHALKFAQRVVCHCPLTTLSGQERGERLWANVELTKLAICSSRPNYGGKGGMTDMCTVEVYRRDARVKYQGTHVEWWP